jgi:TRAP-type C4-dicarboxylate transport system permease small subunit
MRGWAGALLTALTALLYLHFAHAAYRAQIGHPLDDWPRWWMFHSLFVCWVLAILVIPVLLGFMTDNMLRPHSTAADSSGQTSG